MSDEENVIQLRRKGYPKCDHGDFLLDQNLMTVECGKCAVHINPIHVLLQIMSGREQAKQRHKRLQLEAEEATKKTRAKCEHCKQMTRIKTNVRDWQVIHGSN